MVARGFTCISSIGVHDNANKTHRHHGCAAWTGCSRSCPAIHTRRRVHGDVRRYAGGRRFGRRDPDAWIGHDADQRGPNPHGVDGGGDRQARVRMAGVPIYLGRPISPSQGNWTINPVGLPANQPVFLIRGFSQFDESGTEQAFNFSPFGSFSPSAAPPL